MKTLYLCTGSVNHYASAGIARREAVLRLVWATDPDEAKALMRAAIGPDLFDVDCTPALGTPQETS